MRIVFDTNTVGYEQYFQTGGGGVKGVPPPPNLQLPTNEPPSLEQLVPTPTPQYNYFRGSPVYQRGVGLQKGAGVGDILKALWRKYLLPAVKQAGLTAGEEGLKTGQRILDKVLQGENLKQAALSEGKKGVDNLLEQAQLPKQFGGSIKRKRKATIPPPFTPLHQTIVGREVKKPLPSNNNKKRRQRADALGFF